MALEALLLSVDAAATRVIRRIMQDLAITVTEVSTAAAASDLLGRHKFDAFIIDAAAARAEDLLQGLRRGTSNRSVIVFVLINGTTTVRQAYTLGANFVFEKPLDFDRCNRSFRAALGLMVRERRRYFRVDVVLPVSYDQGGNVQKVTATNLSETGLAVRGARKLPVGASLRLTFTLPNGTPMDCRAEVAWSTDDGRAGLRYVTLPEAGRRQLTAFIASAANSEEYLPGASNGSYTGSKAAL